jgi:hypothetical protein
MLRRFPVVVTVTTKELLQAQFGILEKVKTLLAFFLLSSPEDSITDHLREEA